MNGQSPSGEQPPIWSLLAREPGQSALDMVNALRAAGAPESEVRSWEVGLRGERMAARIFERLGDEWTVLHDVPVGTQGANIDHVLISDAGVFTINTKHHPKATVVISGPDVLVRNEPQHYIDKAMFEGRRASRLLSDCTGKHIPVQPILLFVGTESVEVHRSPMGVLIADSGTILPMLDSFSYSLTPSTLDAVLAAAVHPETWAQGVTLQSSPARHGSRVVGTPVRTYTSDTEWRRTTRGSRPPQRARRTTKRHADIDWNRAITKAAVPSREKKPASCLQIALILGLLFIAMLFLASATGG